MPSRQQKKRQADKIRYAKRRMMNKDKSVDNKAKAKAKNNRAVFDESSSKVMSHRSRCVVRDCPNAISSKGPRMIVSFHKFPRDLDFREELIARLNVDKRAITENSTVCSEHFDADELRNLRRRNRDLLRKPAISVNEKEDDGQCTSSLILIDPPIGKHRRQIRQEPTFDRSFGRKPEQVAESSGESSRTIQRKRVHETYRCAVPGCDVESDRGIPMFSVPVSAFQSKRRVAWIRLIGLGHPLVSEKSSKSAKVCGLHFADRDVVIELDDEPARLAFGAVPVMVKQGKMTETRKQDSLTTATSDSELGIYADLLAVSQRPAPMSSMLIEQAATDIALTTISVKEEYDDDVNNSDEAPSYPGIRVIVKQESEIGESNCIDEGRIKREIGTETADSNVPLANNTSIKQECEWSQPE